MANHNIVMQICQSLLLKVNDTKCVTSYYKTDESPALSAGYVLHYVSVIKLSVWEFCDCMA